MMSMPIKNLSALMEDILNQLNYTLVNFELANQGRLLRVFIDKLNPTSIHDSVNLDDCAFVSNQLSYRLALEKGVDYDRLEISSPGMDRILSKEADFIRFSGEQIVVKLRTTSADSLQGRVRSTKLIGTCLGIENGYLLLAREGVTERIALQDIDKSRLHPIFKVKSGRMVK